ncbi:hypothetical protein DEU56DRAFT_757676 [Suillus clintonianus]|uniref:uncharacterized protein n=1 Tax=Suillus clintonianus TaxID=1904413 RepID=UPI001B8731A7|nr:uncharacterized protein DEU56DRAFT_757676 [Suillus clintonianus]KAG2131051.1 hypothetical protein DEU56DRAFT_757676 [Suillus clintonianus]
MTDWPTLPGVPPEANFPWLRTWDGLDKLPFNVNLVDGVLYACSPNCTHATDDDSPCIPCQQLQSRVHSLANLAGERKNHTRHNVLTPIQLLDVINERNVNLNTVKLQDALECGYRPRTRGKEADDLALLILRLGGHNLLYALSQRLSLPSLRTLGRHTSFVKIAPIIGQITMGVIQHNIAAVVLAPRAQAGLNTLRGMSFLIDETALEEAAGYLPQSNSIGGLCWTHSHLVDTTLNNYQSALGVADALKSGKVHLSKELTVASAHVFGEDGIYPILAAPTCKSENFTDMEFVFESVIDLWYASGADRAVGPAWSFATDGDATRRKAGHRTFLCNNINFTSPLFGTLINLPGLNLLTGKHEMTLDFDDKHVFKCFCTLIRSCAGMRPDNGRCINSSMLEHYLTWVDNIDESRALKLLYPDDPQDVPRAVALMNIVISLGNIDPTLPPYTLDGTEPDVDVIADFDAIKILSHILHSLLQPFINITLSLTEQVISLCRCTHLIYACYRNQRRAFMPNQLYYDVQTLIKNIIFCIAKQQKLDATQPFTLLDTGDDPIELLFVFLRMCGGHNSAVNYKQALDRLESVDHINRSMWVGDIISGHCNLPSAWKQGQDVATQFLQLTQIPPQAYDFNSYFSFGSSMDLLCVFGEGKYPSVNDGDTEEDRSLNVRVVSSIPTENVGDEPAEPETSLAPAEEGADENDPIHNFEEMLEDKFDPTQPEDLDDSPKILEDDTPTAPPKGPGIRPADYLWCEKKWVHKQTVCRLIITPNFTPKSQVRLLHVRGFTSVNKKADVDEVSNILHGEHFVTGDLFLTLICSQGKVLSLALTRATSISENGLSRGRINTATLASLWSNVKVVGEMMVLLPSISSTPESSALWVWNGGYLKTASPVPGTNAVTQRVVTLSIPGHLLELANPRVVNALEHLAPDQASEVNSKGSSWALSNDGLEAAAASVWMKIVESKLPINSISALSSESSMFPYKDLSGSDALVCVAGTTMLAASGRGKGVASTCPLCGEATKDLRSHMGCHILRAARGIPDNVTTAVSGPQPCGFCGRSGVAKCTVTFKESGRSVTWESQCPHKENFQYGSTNKGSDNRPCRNVPVVCKLCVHQNRQMDWRPAIWRYNLEAHMNDHHPEYAHPGKPHSGLPLPTNMFDTMMLTPVEQTRLGVPPQPLFTLTVPISEKENIPASASGRKHKGDTQMFSAAASSKRARRT